MNEFVFEDLRRSPLIWLSRYRDRDLQNGQFRYGNQRQGQRWWNQPWWWKGSYLPYRREVKNTACQGGFHRHYKVMLNIKIDNKDRQWKITSELSQEPTSCFNTNWKARRHLYPFNLWYVIMIRTPRPSRFLAVNDPIPLKQPGPKLMAWVAVSGKLGQWIGRVKIWLQSGHVIDDFNW